MTATIDPDIQQRYDQNAAAQRAAEAQAGTELKARQQEVAERVKATEEAFAKIGRSLTEPKPKPARRQEDNDLSAKAEAYQEVDDDPPPAAPPPPAPVVRRADEDEEVASFRWDEDPPAKPEPPRARPLPADEPPAQQAKPRRRDVDEDLSNHDWLE